VRSEDKDLLFSEEEVEFLLSSIDPNKATGPDGISARMLKSTAASIAPAVMAIYNLSLIQVAYGVESGSSHTNTQV